ncbi:hypothetical protein K503DRAFT_784693 [Rhizopogon vinicolor AM-OR11-026]|uniref:Uncharacterized protein n=1 Tax=Rhizopogon vinicolor AM-OR11-026 TaxID=1314800 RepID=A0A1B7MTN5_9AGAM|nr:hypothetical protein K503DRAFT_784693 [Rhizopogon vinicolor AM-OR11-026]
MYQLADTVCPEGVWDVTERFKGRKHHLPNRREEICGENSAETRNVDLMGLTQLAMVLPTGQVLWTFYPSNGGKELSSAPTPNAKAPFPSSSTTSLSAACASSPATPTYPDVPFLTQLLSQAPRKKEDSRSFPRHHSISHRVFITYMMRIACNGTTYIDLNKYHHIFVHLLPRETSSRTLM